jgi:hypothetical protein
MMAGMTNPSRPWFNLTVKDRNLREDLQVQRWLEEVTRRMLDVLARSNFYKVMPLMYADMATFGTGAMGVRRDPQTIIHFEPYPIGSYWIGNDKKGLPKVFMREFQMTVRQVVEEYATDPVTGKVDYSIVSQGVEDLHRRGNMEAWVILVHAVVPNWDYDPKMAESRFKKYISVHYELGMPNQSVPQGSLDEKLLRVSGFDLHPILAGRWEVNDGDAYGTSCPGMDALPDIKQLQRAERRGLQAIDKMVSPPLAAPPELRGHKISQLPGDVTYYSGRGGQKIEPIQQVNYRLDHHEAKQDQVRARILQFFHADTFRSILDRAGSQPLTAREVQEVHEEKMVDLIPVLEQNNQDMFDPLVDLVFDRMLEADQIPAPPDQLEDVDLEVEYVSVMAQAQKLVGVASIEQFAGFAMNVTAQTQNEELLDKINQDAMIEAYGRAVSVPADILRDQAEVDSIRAERQEQIRQAQEAERIQQLSQSAKNLSGADMEGDNALNRIAEQSQEIL